MNPTHRIAVTVGAQWLNFDVFSTTLDTLLASRRYSSVELATVPLGEFEMVQRYAAAYAKPLRMYPSETEEILNSVDEVIAFMDMDDDITKHMVQIARARGLPIQVILVNAFEDSVPEWTPFSTI